MERFWTKVYKTNSCWFWLGAIKEKGYGAFMFPPTKRAHHVAWFLTFGKWPEKNLLHTCDTPQCVNPAHLREGTNLENHQDSAKKGINPNLRRQSKKFCKYGHPRTTKNLYVAPSGSRGCRICRNNRVYEFQARHPRGQAMAKQLGEIQ